MTFSLPHLSQFLRLSYDTPPNIAYTLMTVHWGIPQPNLVVSVVGGEGKVKVKTWVREVLRQGLVKAAQSTGDSPILSPSLVLLHVNSHLSCFHISCLDVWILACVFVCTVHMGHMSLSVSCPHYIIVESLYTQRPEGMGVWWKKWFCKQSPSLFRMAHEGRALPLRVCG